jgi:Fe-Mn family superoxide dismutase
MPAQRELLVYCVYGHEVSRVAALRLRAAGLHARYLLGGIEGWRAAGRPLDAKAAA